MHIGEPLPAFTKGDGKLNTVDTVSVRHGNNDFQNRSRLTADVFFAACERGSANALIPTVRYYATLSQSAPVSISRWKPGSALSRKFMKWTMPIDTKTSDPLNFTWLAHQYSWRGSVNDQLVNATNLRVKEHPSKTHAMLCAWEYAQAKYEAKPVFHEIEQSVLNFHRHYVRALLPIVDEFDTVTRLLSISQPIQKA